MTKVPLLWGVLGLGLSLMSGCVHRETLNADICRQQAVVFDSLKVRGISYVKGVGIERIDGESALSDKDRNWKLVFADDKRSGMAWVIPPGYHVLGLHYVNEPLGSTKNAWVIVGVKLEADGQYRPKAEPNGNLLTLSLVDPRTERVVAGPVEADINSSMVVELPMVPGAPH
jgi:hypothetical protein